MSSKHHTKDPFVNLREELIRLRGRRYTWSHSLGSDELRWHRRKTVKTGVKLYRVEDEQLCDELAGLLEKAYRTPEQVREDELREQVLARDRALDLLNSETIIKPLSTNEEEHLLWHGEKLYTWDEDDEWFKIRDGKRIPITKAKLKSSCKRWLAKARQQDKEHKAPAQQTATANGELKRDKYGVKLFSNDGKHFLNFAVNNSTKFPGFVSVRTFVAGKPWLYTFGPKEMRALAREVIRGLSAKDKRELL